MELVYIYFIFLNKIITNFLTFFQFFSTKFTPLESDPGGKMNADPHSTALLKSRQNTIISTFSPDELWGRYADSLTHIQSYPDPVFALDINK